MMYPRCRSGGGIGRRDGFKIRFPQGSGGSSPPLSIGGEMAIHPIQSLRATLVLAALLLAGCKTTRSADQPLYVSPDSYNFGSNPKLLERILATPHGYFRFVNVPFSEEVCRRFSSELKELPVVNLHGDAHLEQYAITDLGRGLTDFDDSSTGPGVIDIIRFGVSLELTARARGWEGESLFHRFLEGYEAALDNPEFLAPVPGVVQRMKEKFKFDRDRYFQWIGSIMDKVEDGEQAALLKSMAPYVETMRLERPDLSRTFFDAKELGYLKMGIGSALDLKYLIRIQGPTEDPKDDVVLEVKEVRDLSAITCIQAGKDSDPFRILVGQSRIAYTPYRYLGYVRFKGRTFWIHSWVDNYRELETPGSFEKAEELSEVVYDIGVQLGRGHPNKIAAPLDLQLRRAQLDIVRRYRARLIKDTKILADQTEAAWRRFKQEVASPG